MTKNDIINTYQTQVVNKFQVYNSLFLNLPFDQIQQVGELLPLLNQACQKGFEEGLSPLDIITAFMAEHFNHVDRENHQAILFKFIQYIERQIVLFDAVEEAAFERNHAINGEGSLPYLAQQSQFLGLTDALKAQLLKHHTRVVLTAHPTQFYPGPVLGIINELAAAIQIDDIATIGTLLKQLGKTPLYKKDKPTPFDEAVSLTWYLENVFYPAAKHINTRLDDLLGEGALQQALQVGFWPGGDRDGNPNVTANITLQVGRRLRSSILKCYFRDIRDLKRRLTFKHVEQMVSAIEKQLYIGAFTQPDDHDYSADQLLSELNAINRCLVDQHQSLFKDQVDTLIRQVETFGFYFASLDIRQDSRVLTQVWEAVSSGADLSDVAQDTMDSLLAIKAIQAENGEAGAHRYIISNCQKADHVLTVLNLFKEAGLSNTFPIDIVPLFETIADLKQAPKVMSALYQDPVYQKHLASRNHRQTIMLGFSDGTKDGGYIAANWSILQAKETLSETASKHGIETLFFDGRGGPPARGGGETHRFYASLSPKIQNHGTQLTIQGQTISANFGHPNSAQFNLEQLMSAGLFNAMSPPEKDWTDHAYQLLDRLSQDSYRCYQEFKNHPLFVPYLEQVSTLKYYGQTNISSRPTKRNDDGALNFEDLRAIPFVGAWSQLKQNVLGYYGVGTALEALINEGQLTSLQSLYQSSGFFKTLMDNCMMSIAKSYMPLTAYLKNDAVFGAFWQIIQAEFDRSQSCLLAITGQQQLMENQPLRKASIAIRESIVLPLLTIQQYALQTIQKLEKDGDDSAQKVDLENMVIRSLYGNINASRNAV